MEKRANPDDFFPKKQKSVLQKLQHTFFNKRVPRIIRGTLGYRFILSNCLQIPLLSALHRQVDVHDLLVYNRHFVTYPTFWVGIIL